MLQTFGPTATNVNACFSDVVGGPGVPTAVSTAAVKKQLYVGRVPAPNSFYDTTGTAPALTQTPNKVTRRDSAGNVIVFFDTSVTGRLPLDGSDCWLFRAGRLNQWFSNRDQ